MSHLFFSHALPSPAKVSLPSAKRRHVFKLVRSRHEGQASCRLDMHNPQRNQPTFLQVRAPPGTSPVFRIQSRYGLR